MAGQTKAFTCPNCGAAVQVRAEGRSLSVVCGSCASIIDPNDPNHKILSTAKQRHVEPVIPLGTRGKFNGVTYEVVGFMIRSDRSGAYNWDEYLLYNPAQGFNWLVQSNGHWSFVKMIKEKPKEGVNGTMVLLQKTFKLFLTDAPKVKYVAGEFYWRVRQWEQVSAMDFVAPPHMLSMESTKNETVWSLGTYMTPDEVRSCFPKEAKIDMPTLFGVAPHQVNPHQRDLEKVMIACILACLICFLMVMPMATGTGNNAFTGILLLCVYPIYAYMRSNNFETQRWSESDYAPMEYESNDDEEDEEA